MGKSSGKQSSELDPAIKAMMQETFNLGKGLIPTASFTKVLKKLLL